MGTRSWFVREPWTVERLLHVALAAVAVIGWTLAYQTLTRKEPQVTRSEPATKLSANIEAQPSVSR